MKELFIKWTNISLVGRIILGLVFGAVFGVLAPTKLSILSMFGVLFVTALKSVAPILVFFLVMSAIAQHESGKETNMKHIIILYLSSTFIAALVAVTISFLLPTSLVFTSSADIVNSPDGLLEVIQTLLLNVVDNPVSALLNANYIGILASAVLLGLALKSSAPSTKQALLDVSNAVSTIVRWVIEFAPFGIMGLVFTTVADGGLTAILSYGRLLFVLLLCMGIVAFVTNPLIVYLNIKKNPYPLVFKCLKESGITAFFTRSSAANIPVNIQLCEKLGIDKDTYSVSIPLGATINMCGAAITINTLTLAAAYSLGINVSFPMAFLLSIVSSLSACGASGVAGGSLLLIPLACSLFGIPSDIAAQVVGIGFIISVIQDSVETALNSSTDALLTITADFRKKLQNGEELEFYKN